MQYRGIEIWMGWHDPMYTPEVRIVASAIVEGKKRDLISSPILHEDEYVQYAKEIENWMMKKIDELLFPDGEPVDLTKFQPALSIASFKEETGIPLYKDRYVN